MNIQIKQLGAISEGTIDLSKKLNVFCGPNGTGKTYMAYVLYALTKLNNKNIGIRPDSEVLKAALTTDEFSIKISPQTLFAYRAKEIEQVRNNLWVLFSIAEEKANLFFKDTEINCEETEEDFVKRITELSVNEEIRIYNYNFQINKSGGSNEMTIKLGDYIMKDEAFAQFMEIVFMSRLYSFLSFSPITSSIIFPVERNSIYTFVKELSIKRNEALEHLEAIATNKNINYLDMYFKRSTRYPQPIRDGLQVAEDLENTQKINSIYYPFAEEIEHKLLKGKVLITKEGSVEFASDKAPRVKLSFHQSSSIVKTLASLVIYLKHQAQINDLVIIDEPELNLHPDNQVKLARIFARMVNKGLRLVVSTHSDYIVREFNNLIMLSSAKAGISEYAESQGYEQDEFIIKNDIAAYVFDYKHPRSKQCTVQRITIGATGFEIPSVDATIENQNNIAEELFYTIKYGAKDE